MVTRYDVIELKAEITKEGFIRDKPIVTRAGIFEYRTPDGKTKREYRPEQSVFATDSLESLKSIPITDGHRGLISDGNVSGIVGTVLSPGERVDENVAAEIIIHDTKKLGKKRELSLGYTCDIKETPGEYKGQRYDCEQTNIVYNHLAVVSKGRAGNARLRLDSTDAVYGDFELEKDDPMPDPTVKLVTIRLDGIDYQASPEVNNALTKTQTDLADLKKRFDGLEAERDSFKTKLTQAEKDIVAAKTGARDEIKARLDLETVATTHKVKFDESDTDRSIKEKILTKVNPALKFDSKSDDYVNSAFDIAMTYETDKTKKVSDQVKKVTNQDSATHDDRPAAISAREQMIMRLRGEAVETDKSKAA
jgi:uncharacterized protein